MIITYPNYSVYFFKAFYSAQLLYHTYGIQKHNTKSDDILLDIPSWCFVYPWLFHLIMAFLKRWIRSRATFDFEIVNYIIDYRPGGEKTRSDTVVYKLLDYYR